MKIVNHFYKFLEIDTPILDVILIGSNANYNWNKFSDIDLHVLINYRDIDDNLHLVKNYLHAKKSIWNLNYPLTYKGINIELYAQDSNTDLHASVGIYSLMQQKWINRPSSTLVSIDNSLIDQKTQPYEFEIDNLKLDDLNLESKIKSILLRLRNLRAAGLEAVGEYSLENLAYKSLRNSGHLAKLKTMLQANTIGQLSINESLNDPKGAIQSLIMHVTKKQTLDDVGWNHVMKHTQGVEDSMGQWKHSGKCTMIPGNQITMKMVPHHVLGIDDLGTIKLMKPEQTYTYPGNKVFEIPVTPQWKTIIMQLRNAIQNGSKYEN
jgi:predicted nucleotidyltransferase